MNVGIVGLGLMGGSMGLALKELPNIKSVIGYDNNELHAKQAIALGLVDEAVSFDEIKKCDLIILAAPVDSIISTLKRLTNIKESATIIDLGSTKEKIVKSVPKDIRKNFIAAHPMCGTERFGPQAALKDLYKDKIVVLCDLEDSGEKQIQIAKDLFISIGMRIVKMNSREHDRHAAFISHLPHAISFALANSVLSQEDPKSILVLAAGGFKDMSRIAKSSPVVWTEIFRQNKHFLLESYEVFEKELSYSKKLIEEERWEELDKWMQKAASLHEIL